MGGLSLLITAPTPLAASPMPMLMLLPAGVQVTGPLAFRFLPSTMTCGPVAAGGAELDAPLFDLLLEKPAQPATSVATPATPTTIPRFTAVLLRVAGCLFVATPHHRQTYRSLRPAHSARWQIPKIKFCKPDRAASRWYPAPRGGDS